jgi:hypothetical protein
LAQPVLSKKVLRWPKPTYAIIQQSLAPANQGSEPEEADRDGEFRLYAEGLERLSKAVSVSLDARRRRFRSRAQ